MQPDAFADAVVVLVKNALAPVLERLATSEQANRDLLSRVQELSGLRDRLVAVETKSAIPLPTIEPVSVDLAPVLERVAATEARLNVLGDLRDRVVTVETKAAMPVITPDHVIVNLAPVFERLAVAETRISDVDKYAARIEGYTSFLQRDMTALSERLAVVEVRPAVPGPSGEPGPPGRDGTDGQPGTAGLSFEGVYQEGKSYDFGHLVTWAGSSWHCNEATTTKPGDGSKAWTLMVKRGRDGRDGVNATGALPVVKVG